MYVKRTIENLLLQLSKSYSCIAVAGPRQTGKSTLIRTLFGENFSYVTFDDSQDLALAKANPNVFLNNYTTPLIIDEIQKCAEILPFIKKRIDDQKFADLHSKHDNNSASLMFVLSGSNKYELQKSVAESLAGRCITVELNSFTQCEIAKSEAQLFAPRIENLKAVYKTYTKNHTAPSRNAMFERIFRGGMPEFITQQLDKETFFKGYVDTYIERDVKGIIKASSELQFRLFIELLALRTGNELHYDEISRAAGIDVKTCKKWLSVLIACGVVMLLRPYKNNANTRIIKAPKLYFLDSGLCCHLCRCQSARMLMNGMLAGQMFETYVISEIFKNWNAFGKDPQNYFFYYRDSAKREIDLLLVDSQSVTPIEIKSGINPAKATKNFSVLEKLKLNINEGIVLDCSEKIRPINETAYSVPAFLVG